MDSNNSDNGESLNTDKYTNYTYSGNGSGSYTADTYSDPGQPPAPGQYAQPNPYAQPGQYSQPNPYSQPGQYSQPNPYAQPGQYSQPNPYAQPGQYSQPNPYAQPGQYSQPDQYASNGQYSQPIQYAPTQYAQPGQYQQYNQYGQYAYNGGQPDRTARPVSKGLSIASMACGVVSICLFQIVAAIVAICLSGKFRRNNNGADNGFSKAGRICGIVGIVVTVAVITLYVIAIIAILYAAEAIPMQS